MALGKCSECNHVMSTTAKFCPNCGSTLPPNKGRLVDCDVCKGSGYTYMAVIENKYYRNIPGCSALSDSGPTYRKETPCSKDYPGATKCHWCKDGKIVKF